VSVVGSNYAIAFPHAEYLGMFFAGAMRTLGRKNPVPTGDLKNVAKFYLTPEGVAIRYVEVRPSISSGGRRRRQTRKFKKQRRTTRKH
jgi:hypothetical protein